MLQCWWRTGHCPLFLSPTWGIWQLKRPHRWEFATRGKKTLKVKVLKLCLNFVKTKTTTPGNNIDTLLITFTAFSSFISFKIHFPYQLFISHTNSHNTLGLPVVALLFNILLSWAFGTCLNGFHCLVMCKPWWFKCYFRCSSWIHCWLLLAVL